MKDRLRNITERFRSNPVPIKIKTPTLQTLSGGGKIIFCLQSVGESNPCYQDENLAS